MKINSILIKAIIKTFNITKKELEDYFKHDIKGAQSSLEINHEYMMDASILFNLLEKLRIKHKDIQEYYAQLYKLNVLHLGLFGNYLLSCKDMYAVHEKLNTYEMLISDFVEFKYHCVADEISCIAQVPYSLVKVEYNITNIDCIIDFEIIFRHRILESIIGGRIRPQRILVYENFYNEEKLTALKQLFDCEITPHKTYNEIIYSVKNYSKNIIYNNYTSNHLLEPLVENHLAKLYNDDNYSRIIKRILMNNLHHFPLTIEEVSKRLLMSVRKIQKILKTENTTYQEVCNDMKKEIAILYLSKDYKIKEIANKLGYKESNSFTRSFKTWFKMTPDDYKEQMLHKKSSNPD